MARASGRDEIIIRGFGSFVPITLKYIRLSEGTNAC